MKRVLIPGLFSLCLPVYGQTTTTYYRGPNYTGFSSFVQPLVIKTTNSYSYSPSYQPSTRTSYNFYTPGSSVPSPFTSSGSRSSGGGGGGIARMAPKGKIFSDNGKFGVKDGYGGIVTPAIYDELIDFSEASDYIGFCKVKQGGKYGILWPTERKPVVPVKYDEIKKLNSSTALVKSNGKVGIIQLLASDKMEIVIPVKYDELGPLDSYCLWARQGDKFGLISILNTVLIPIKYDDITDFSLKAVMVKKDDKYGLINVRNEVVLPLEYESISAVSEGLAWILKGGKWGLINANCEILAAPQYDTVFAQTDGRVWLNNKAMATKNGRRITINRQGKEEGN